MLPESQRKEVLFGWLVGWMVVFGFMYFFLLSVCFSERVWLFMLF